MRILMLGGSRFVGRHIVTECLARGDEVTIFYRAQSPSPFVGLLRHIITDRRVLTPEAKTVLAESWDAVIDTSARDLEDVRSTAVPLRSVARYVFVSSCGVYSRIRRNSEEITERSPVIRSDLTDPVRANASRRLRCERFLHRQCTRVGVPLLIARLGLVVGAYDYSQRLAYWLERALRGGDMLVPMDPGQPLRLVDAADVARYLRDTLDKGATGVVNVAGKRTTALQLVDTLVTVADNSLTPQWVGEEFALTHDILPWTQVPLWLPLHNPERALMHVSSQHAEHTGLTYTTLSETLADCLAWHRLNRGWSQRWLDHAREYHLLHLWRP